ncbi:MAG TPA: DUF885 domain-containing protein [Ramlibacter sp.]|nr:DUF885 domain-containing protein [Ramlibacter sp.]
MKRFIAIAATALALLAPLAARAAVDPQETRKLHALFDAEWEDAMRRYPEFASDLGDYRYNDRLQDRSAAARTATDQHVRDSLKAARAIRRDALSRDDQVSLDVFIHDGVEAVEAQAFPGYRAMLIGALWGPQSRLADLAERSPIDSALRVEQLLKRYAAYPKTVDDEIAHMREGMAIGWVPARDVLERALSQLDKQLAGPVESSPWYEPFTKMKPEVAAADREKLQAAARESVARDVVLPLRRLRAFIVDELRPKAPAEGALRNYPDGTKVYDYLVRSRTTTPLNAKQVHEIGVRELAAIQTEMEGVMREVKFQGTFPQFVNYLNTDPKFYYTKPDDLLAGYRAIGKRLDAELPRYFAELPRVPWGVRAMPAFRGPDAVEFYDRPSQDGSRPGYFNANVLGLQSKPKWGMATLTAHEAVPGHHLQIARAQEIKGLPKFRGYAWSVAYGEGWAMYAETLAREMGIYDDPYSMFGHLQYRAFRAARLVVDTGIHSMGWTRKQSIDFMVERTGMDRGFIESEVDRYVSDPGQALGYMIGALKFKELREKAKAKLGAKFDVRRFHNVVLDGGPLPLDVLEKVTDAWIASESSH